MNDNLNEKSIQNALAAATATVKNLWKNALSKLVHNSGM